MEFTTEEISGLFDKWMDTRDYYKNEGGDFEQGKCQAYSEVLTATGNLVDKKMEEHINELLDKGVNEQDIVGREDMTVKFTEEEIRELFNEWLELKEHYRDKEGDLEQGKHQAYDEVLDDISNLVDNKKKKQIMEQMEKQGLFD